MAETVLKSLLEDRISLKDVIEWLSSDVDELKLANDNCSVCSKGEFVLHILNLLRQSFLSVHQLNNLSSRALSLSSKTGGNIKTKEKSNQTINTVKSQSVKRERTPNIIQDAPELRRGDRSGLLHTFSPPDIKANQGEVLNLSFKTTDTSLMRTPPRSSFPGENHLLTPILRKQRSAERDSRLRNSEGMQSSPVMDSRLKNNNRSLTLADFMKESPNQKKRQGNNTPRSERIATSTPSRDSMREGSPFLHGGSEVSEDRSSTSPIWKNKRPQRRIKPTKILSFDDEKSPKSGFPNDETFGVVARAQGKSTFEEQADINAPQRSISFAEERSLLMDERLKLQNKSNQSTSPKITTLPNTPAKTAVVKEVADPNQVTFQNHLLILCDLYSSIIDANLVPNIMTELHFVLSLLVVQRSSPVKKQKTSSHESASNEINEKSSIESKLEESIRNISFDKEKTCIDISKEEKDVINSEEKKVDLKSQSDCSLTDTSKTPNQSDSNHVSPRPSEEDAGRKGSVEESPAHLDTVHNCVFFATNLLWRQTHLLSHLDRVTMKLLLDNERVATFMPNLTLAVQDLYNKASSRTTTGQITASSVVFNYSTSENVTFHSERDNSTNFESSNAFKSFRKQRDAFYDIFQIWEADHLNPSWNFNAALKPKIRALLDMCRDSTNYMHLARLFRMQLEAAIMGGKRLSDDLDSSFLECLRGVDPEKLSRLRERLVTPHSSDGPRPSPQFPGQQEFFREFIMAVDNVSFIEHLKDNLVSHLLELDQTDYCASDVEESDLVVDEETRQSYINCVGTMQLLAKFLGFIVFLPYKKPSDIPRNIIEAELAIRAKVGPPLNVMACVMDAWTNRRLVVTLPWVVQYLGMLDEGSVELPFYRNTIVLLLQLYAGLARDIGKGYPIAPEEMAPRTVTLLRFVLGWLFELPCLPDGLLFLWKRTCTEQDYLQGTPDNSLIVKRSHRENLPCLNWSSSLSGAPSAPIDSLDLVDTAVLYALCPFLLGLRGLLSTVQEGNASASGTVRHITPVSTTLVLPEPVSTAQLELQLEESFFHGLPESVQKTVEFVVERITSACIKQICNTLIPVMKERGMTKFKNAVAEEMKNGMNKSTEEKLIKRRDLVVKQVVAEMRSKCNDDVEKNCSERCKAALTALLSPVSLPPAVCEMCISISSRLSTERVTAWFRTHATFKTYAAELQSELRKALCNKGIDKEASTVAEKTSHLAACPGRKHDDSAPSPGDVLVSFRDLICEILEMHGEGISQGIVDKIIDDVGWLIKDRADVTPAAERSFSVLLLDLSVALVCHCPDLVTDSFIQRVIALWKTAALRPTDSTLSRIICPRNVLLLAQSSHSAAKVWNRLAQIVGATLNEELVTADDVESQCLTILQQAWPQVVLMNFSTCVSEIVRIYRKKKVNLDTEKFEYLLNWLAEITKYMEDFPD